MINAILIFGAFCLGLIVGSNIGYGACLKTIDEAKKRGLIE